MKFYAIMQGKDGKEFRYSIEDEDLFSAGERAEKLAKGYGWLFIGLETE